MLVDDEFRKRVDRMMWENQFPLALAPRTQSDVFPAEQGDGSGQFALNDLGKRIVRGWMAQSGADKRFDHTMGQITGSQFSPAEIRILEDRALGAADWSDVSALKGVEEGSPVYLTPRQKGVVDGLMNHMGSDPLGQRSRDAYEKAFDGGAVRLR